MNIAHLLRQTVTRAAFTGKSAKGDNTYGSQTSIPCRLESARRTVRSVSGAEVMPSHVFWTLTEIALTDRIWLPGASLSDNAVAKTPVNVKALPSLRADFTLYEVALS